MQYRYKRIVVGRNSEGKSAVLTTTSDNVQFAPNQYYRATLWSTSETPVDNSIEGDRGANRRDRVPPKNGSHIRALELYPEDPDRAKALAEAQAANKEFPQPYQPTAEMLARDPGMHHTDTLDMAFVFSDEIDLITDVDEIHCTPGDCILVKGVSHARRVRGSEPCLMMGVSLDALPLKSPRFAQTTGI